MFIVVDVVCEEFSSDPDAPVWVDLVCEEIDPNATPWAEWVRTAGTEEEAD